MHRTPIRLHVISEIDQTMQQDEAKERFDYTVKGETFTMGGATYITYIEEWNDQVSEVQVKIEGEEAVTIQRKTASQKIIMPFKKAQETLIYYPISVNQALELNGELQAVSHSVVDDETTEYQIHYQLIQGEEILGKYGITLQYKPEVV